MACKKLNGKANMKALPLITLVISLISLTAQSAIITKVSYPRAWYPRNSSVITGRCVYTINDRQPLSDIKTLVVDNTLPNGSVLYTWNHGDFFSESHTCYNDSTSPGFIPGTTTAFQITGIYFPNSNTVTGYLPTNNPGISLKLYKRVNTGSGSYNYNQTVGTEVPITSMTPNSPANADTSMSLKDSRTGNQPVFNPSLHYANVSLRAELIKTGTVTFTALSSPLYVPNYNTIHMGIMPESGPTQTDRENLTFSIGANGIRVIAPACKLQSTDYSVNLNRWIMKGPGSALYPGTPLPATGNSVPIGITLACSGKTNNVRFKFQDIGASPLTNKNVSLYDKIAGAKINGLEIEMLYNNSRINVDNMATTNTGSHGSTRTNPADISFNMASSATFEARYIQRTAITRNGVPYTGPIVGKVNMWVTHD